MYSSTTNVGSKALLQLYFWMINLPEPYTRIQRSFKSILMWLITRIGFKEWRCDLIFLVPLCLASATQSYVQIEGMNIFWILDSLTRCGMTLIVQMLEKYIFIGGDFIPKKETRLGFTNSNLETDLIKVHIFWEGHKILRNLHLTFDWLYIETVAQNLRLD